MPETSCLSKAPLPQSYYHHNAENIDTIRQCIRDARLAGCNPQAPPVERHLHRIIARAERETLLYIMSHQPAQTDCVKRLVNDAIRQLENIRLEAAR